MGWSWRGMLLGWDAILGDRKDRKQVIRKKNPREEQGTGHRGCLQAGGAAGDMRDPTERTTVLEEQGERRALAIYISLASSEVSFISQAGTCP